MIKRMRKLEMPKDIGLAFYPVPADKSDTILRNAHGVHQTMIPVLQDKVETDFFSAEDHLLIRVGPPLTRSPRSRGRRQGSADTANRKT